MRRFSVSADATPTTLGCARERSSRRRVHDVFARRVTDLRDPLKISPSRFLVRGRNRRYATVRESFGTWIRRGWSGMNEERRPRKSPSKARTFPFVSPTTTFSLDEMKFAFHLMREVVARPTRARTRFGSATEAILRIN